MKVGDLVKVKECGPPGDAILGDFSETCECFFCQGNSNKIGVVVGPAPMNKWHVLFDCGAWRLDDFDEARGDVEVIGEAKI
jgi:hypothetical protein